MPRFSKKTMLSRIEQTCAWCEKEYRFDPSNGFAQVIPPGATERERAMIVRAYQFGRYDQAVDLLQSLEE